MTHRRHWTDIGERGALLGMRVMFALYRLLGRRLLTLALYPVVCWYYLFNGSARRASTEYLTRLRDHHPEIALAVNRRTSIRHFVAFADSMLDKLAVWRGDIGADAVAFHNYAQIAELIERGSGAVILTSHLGNTEVCRALAELKPHVRLNVLVHTRHANKFNRLMEELTGYRQMQLIQVSAFDPVMAMQLNERVRRGEFLVIAADRTPPSHSQRCSTAMFLGAPAPFPQGPFILAALLGCPVLALFCLRRAGHYDAYFEHLGERLTLARDDREHDLARHIQRYAALLERYCRVAPLQWFNFYPFWDLAMPRPRRI